MSDEKHFQEALMDLRDKTLEMMKSLSMSGEAAPRPNPVRSSSAWRITGPYKAGDVIMAADPFVHILKQDLRGERCDNCYKNSDALMRCARCRNFKYCSKECQKEDWKSFHKFGECDFYCKLSVSDSDTKTAVELVLQSDSTKCPDVAPLLLRTYLMVKAKPDLMVKKFTMPGGKERSLMDLMDDDDVCNEINLIFRAIMTAFCVVDQSFAADEDLIKSLYHKIRINSFSIDHMNEKKSNGHAVYIQTSIFDHSCRSNAAWVFRGKRMEVRAMRDIPAGEEVLVHYTDILLPKKKRQLNLLVGWGFTCMCPRCQSGDQANEVAELARNSEYHEDTLTVRNLSRLSEDEQANRIFYGLLKVLPIKEKYCGPYDPYMTHDMFLAVSYMSSKRRMTPRDKTELKKLIVKVEDAIKATHGADHELFSGLPFMKMMIALGKK